MERKDSNRKKLQTGEYYNSKTKTYQFRKYKDGRRFTVTAKNLDELRAKKKALLNGVENGSWDKMQIARKTSLSEYCEKWFDVFQKSMKPTTLSNYKSYYKSYIEESDFGNMPIGKIVFSDCQLLFTTLTAEGKARSTQANLKSLLSQVFELALQDEIITKNPVSGVKIDKDAKTKKKGSLTNNQMDLFLSYLKDTRNYYYPYFVVLFNTGMRAGEAGGLTWSDVDFEKNTINIDKSLNRYRKEQYGFTTGCGTPKSKTSKRTIRMTPVIHRALLTVKTNCHRDKDYKIPFIDDKGNVKGMIGDFVFLNQLGNVITEPSAQRTLNNIIKKYNTHREADQPELERFTLHEIRHSYTTVCYDYGIDVKQTAQNLGHKSTRTTIDIYTSLSESKAQEEQQKLDMIAIGM